MSRKLTFALGLLGGNLLFALVYTWTVQPVEARKSNLAAVEKPILSVAEENNGNPGQNEQLEIIKQQLVAEQVMFREQLTILQNALQDHIEESEAMQYMGALDPDSELDADMDTYQESYSEQELRHQIEQSDYLQQEEIASRLNVEEADPEWSGWAESAIRAGLETNVDLNSRLTHVECRTTFCRIEGDFRDPDSRGEVISSLMGVIPWEAQAFFLDDMQEDAAGGALYITKEGVTELPNS